MLLRLLTVAATSAAVAVAQLERMSAAAAEDSTRITDNDKLACRELKNEYRRVCLSERQRSHEEEFCRAFENVCIRLAQKSRQLDEEERSAAAQEAPQQQQRKSARPSHSRPDFTEFCNRFKNRYLFVCPNPFRFGQKAVVFCPIYSERCDVALPEKPVVPRSQQKSKPAFEQLCASYANFANTYCRNALFLAQAQYRESCEKYWRFCMPR